MTHFLLSTPAGSLLMVLVASAVVALVVSCAVRLAAALIALALWRLYCALRDRAARPGPPRDRWPAPRSQLRRDA